MKFIMSRKRIKRTFLERVGKKPLKEIRVIDPIFVKTYTYNRNLNINK